MKRYSLFALFVELVLVLSACGEGQTGFSDGTPVPVHPTATNVPVHPTATNVPVQPTATNVPVQPTTAPSNPQITYTAFVPNLSGLPTGCPSVDEILAAFGLTRDMLDIVAPADPNAVWEVCMVTIEFKPEKRNTTIKLDKPGYFITAALTDQSVTDVWSGDTNLTMISLLWGATFRYAPTYVNSPLGSWLNPNDQCEAVTRDWRFGRYFRSKGMPNTPYYQRFGPYSTKPGNTNCPGWVPPSMKDFVPQSYLQAAALLGGRAVESEWKHSDDNANWAWKHSNKGTSREGQDFYWQTVYDPSPNGYVELWYQGGPKKFFQKDQAALLDGRHNIDEFSYHSDPNN